MGPALCLQVESGAGVYDASGEIRDEEIELIKSIIKGETRHLISGEPRGYL